MASSGVDCWLARVNKMQSLLDISDRFYFIKGSGKVTTTKLNSQFDRHWLDCLNMTKTNPNQDPADTTDHNKLRTYRTYKSSFTREPYIDLVRNRNQKSSLVRLRTGSHFLGVERGRWSRPVTPLAQRTCAYCSTPTSGTPPTTTSTPCSPPRTSTSSHSGPSTAPVDDEQHFVMICTRFDEERNTAFEEISALVPNFSNLNEQQKFTTFLCPTQPKTVKIANRLIKSMFEVREKIDQARNNVNVAMPSD